MLFYSCNNDPDPMTLKYEPYLDIQKIIIIIIIRNAKIIVTLSQERYRGTLQSQ